MSTHSDLHCQQSLACVFGVNGELDGQRGGHPSGVEAGSAGTHLTGIVGGEHLHLVGADGGREDRLLTHKQTVKRNKCSDVGKCRCVLLCVPAWDLLVSVQHINRIGPLSGGDIVDCVSLVTVIHHFHRLHHTLTQKQKINTIF